jgi:hypothetical protein
MGTGGCPTVTTIALIFVVVFISLDLVEDCSIAGYEEEEYGDTRLPYGVQRTRTPDSLVSRYRAVVFHSTST